MSEQRRYLTRGWRPSFLVVLLPLACLLFVAIAAAACGDDDDGASPTATETSEPGAETPTPSPAATATEDGDGGATETPGGATEDPDGGETTPPAGSRGTGTAMIGGVEYEFDVQTCAMNAESVYVIGFGSLPDGTPFIGTATWFGKDYLGVENAIDVGIGVNSRSLLELPDKVYKLGHSIEGSNVQSVEIDVTGFDLTASGLFVDLEAPEEPALEGTFSVACS